MRYFPLIFFFLSFSLQGQGYKHFSLDDGLPSKRVYKIIQDKNGFIWIATDKGLAKFDGEKFKVFTIRDGLPSNDIWNVIETKDGKIWYFSIADKSGYIFNDKVYSFPFENNNGLIYPLHVNTDKNTIIITDINRRKEYVLKNGVWKTLDNDDISLKQHVIHPEIDYISFNPEKDTILLKFHGNKKRYLAVPHQTTPGFYAFQINDSLFFFGDVNSSRLHFLNLNSLEIFQTSLNLPFDKIFSFQINDFNGSIQIIANNFYAELDKNYRIVNKKNFDKLTSNWRAFKDREGNFWLSTFNKGIYLFLKKHLNPKYYFHNEPVRFLRKTNNYIVTSILDKGVYLYDSIKKDFIPFIKKPDRVHYFYMEHPRTYGIYADAYSVFYKNGKKVDLGNRIFKRMYKLGEKYFFTTSFDLVVFDSTFHRIKTLPISSWNFIYRFQDKIITATNGGLYEITPDISINKIYEDFNKPVLSLENHDNLLFIGTDGFGVYTVDKQKKIRHIQGTENMIINDMEFYDNRLWLATQKGIMVYKLEKDSLIFDFALRKYDGIISDQIINIILENGKLFAASYSGISISDAVPPKGNTIHKIYFDEIHYGKKPLSPTVNRFRYRKNTDLSIHFSVVDFSGQEHNNYFYRLLPENKDWKTIANKTITLSNLPPGEYAFEVMAKNPYGQRISTSYSFEIEPLWWQTGWAKAGEFILMLMLFGMALFFIRRFEINKTNRKLEIQKKMAEFELHALRSQMNPHFVFNSLNAIQYYISDENYNQSEVYLVKFARLIRMIFDFTKKKEILLKDELNLLKSYLTLEKMRFGDKLNFEIKIDPGININSEKIPTMLLQPIVENAVNHGIFHKNTPGKVVLEFNKTADNALEIIISDDGVGVKKAEEIKRKSLRKHLSRASEILMERIRLLNLSGKWNVDYKFEDLTGDKNTPFSTRVTLKIKKL
jgi:hypothetical protein